VSRGVGRTEEGAQWVTWIRNKLVFLRNPANRKGYIIARAETAPEEEAEDFSCSTIGWFVKAPGG
jgi:hypothetical protein